MSADFTSIQNFHERAVYEAVETRAKRFPHLATPELLALPNVQIKTIAGAEQVVVAGHIGQEAEALMLAQVRGPKKQEQLREQVAQHNALVAAQLAPAARGVPFAPLPTLAYREDAQAPLWPLEREAVLDLYLQALGMSFGPADPDDEPAPRAPARTKEQAIKVGVSARMSLQKEFISEAEALGLMRPEVAEENRRLADAVATKYGAGTDAEVPFA